MSDPIKLLCCVRNRLFGRRKTKLRSQQGQCGGPLVALQSLMQKQILLQLHKANENTLKSNRVLLTGRSWQELCSTYTFLSQVESVPQCVLILCQCAPQNLAKCCHYSSYTLYTVDSDSTMLCNSHLRE